MSAATWFAVGLFTIGVLLLIIYMRTGKMLRCILFSAVTGLLALGVVWLIGRFFPLEIAITPYTLVASGVLGIPGVLGLLLLALI